VARAFAIFTVFLVLAERIELQGMRKRGARELFSLFPVYPRQDATAPGEKAPHIYK